MNATNEQPPIPEVTGDAYRLPPPEAPAPRRETVIRQLASCLDAYRNCVASGNVEWERAHLERIRTIERNYMPSGSGLDNGTRVDVDSCRANRIVFTTAYHHMNENGYYDGWTDHVVTVRPGFNGLEIKVYGRNRNDIKDHIAETFDWCLNESHPVA